MKTVSLHSRLLLALLIPTLLFMVIFSIILVSLRFQDIRSLQAETGRILLGRYALAMSSQPDNTQWPAILQTGLNEKYLRTIALLTAQGHVIAHAGPQFSAAITTQHLTKAATTKTTYLSLNDARLYLQQMPIAHQPPIYLAIELNPHTFTIARYEAIIGVSMTTFGLMTILLLLVSSRIRRLLEPVNLMAQHLKSLNSQTLNTPLNSHAVGDLWLLENVINDFLRSMAREHEELEHSVEQANADLNANLETMEAQNIELRMARNAAVEGNRIKSAFLANISHELRTPLNSINGFTHVLLKMPLATKQRDCVETIQKSSNNLLAIINDVLDFSKIEAGKFSLEKQPLWIEDVVFDVLESLSPQAGQKHLEQVAFIYDDVPKRLIGDALRLKQVLTNLVSNAIKFTAEGEIVVRVMLEDSRPSHNLLRISVSDTGIGLSNTAKNDLFKAFQQGNPSVSRQFGGTGLGLAISQNIVKLMEGEISFDDQQEQGSTFWFTFKAGICHDAISPPINLVGKKILVLETNPRSAQLLKSTLFGAEADVTVVNDWPALLQLLPHQYHVVIFSGQTLNDTHRTYLSQLRQHFDGLVVMLTSIGDTSSLDEHELEQRQIYSLAKPIRPCSLLSLVAQGLLTAKFNQPHPSSVTLSSPSVAPHANLHILAVDDHPLNLKLVCTLLHDFGIQVTAAQSGQEAVELARRQVFDLIFMDIQMPDISGLEATQRIRQHEGNGPHVPIIALTAHALADEKEQMLAQGMNDYLTKPLQESQLAYMIEHWTGQPLINQPSSHTFVATPDHPSALPLIDQQECIRLAAGKVDLAQDMLDMLVAGLATQRDKLQKSQQEANFPALLAHTHYLHGATHYCGTPRLRDAARRLETHLKAELKGNHSSDALATMLTPDITDLLNVIDAMLDWQTTHNSSLFIHHQEPSSAIEL